MKKITLLTALLCTLFSVAQSSVEITSQIPATLEIGQTFDITIDYDKDGKTMNYFDITLRQLNEAGDMRIVDASPIFPSAQANQDSGTFTASYTIQETNTDATFPDSFDGQTLPTTAQLTEGSYVMVAFMELQSGNTPPYSPMNPQFLYPGATLVPVTIVPAGSLSTNDFNKTKLASVYPNPAKSTVNFGSDVKSDSYQVYDITGQLVADKKATGSLDVSNLSKGIYLIVTDSGNARIVKE